MKAIKLFIYLFSIFCISQTNTFQGNAVFTPEHLKQLGDRIILFSNGQFTPDSGDYNDMNSFYRGAEEYHSDYQTYGYATTDFRRWFATENPIPPCGPWANQYGANAEIFENSAAYNSSNRIAGKAYSDWAVLNKHFAARFAAATKGRPETIVFRGQNRIAADVSQELFNYVWLGILADAQSNLLDPSRGGLLRTAGEPTRPNATYGQTDGRYPRNIAVFDTQCSPWFQLAGSIFRDLTDFSLIVGNVTHPSYTAIYEGSFTNLDYVKEWFEDFYEFYYIWVDRMMIQGLGTGWKEGNYNLAGSWVGPLGGSTTPGSTSRQSHTYFDYQGNPTGNEVSVMQANVLNNRQLEHVGYIAAYGLIFNIPEMNALSFHMWDMYLKYLVFSNGIQAETYRFYDFQNVQNYPASGAGVGFNYLSGNMTNWGLVCHMHAVAVNNGFQGVTDVGKFYDHTTSGGTSDFPNYASEDTDGGQKNFKLLIDTYAKYFKTTANGGFAPAFTNDPNAQYVEHSVVMDAQRNVFTNFVDLANLYYQDTGLYDYADMNPAAGFAFPKAHYPTTVNTGGFEQWQHGNGFGNSLAVYTFKDFINVFNGVIPTLPDLPVLITNDSKTFYEDFYIEN